MNVVSVVVLCQEMVCVSLMEKQGQTRSSKLLCIFGGRHVVIWRSSALHGNEKSSKQLYILSNATIWGGGNYEAFQRCVCCIPIMINKIKRTNQPGHSFILACCSFFKIVSSFILLFWIIFKKARENKLCPILEYKQVNIYLQL